VLASVSSCVMGLVVGSSVKDALTSYLLVGKKGTFDCSRGGSMQSTEHKTFGRPDETREFPNGRAEILTVGDAEIGRLVLEPGWRWSNDVKPIAQTDSCQAPHFQYHVSGRLAIRMDDGTEFVAGPGDVTSLPSGHDAWVVGEEPVVVVDWFGASNYAKQP
jgi:hypothetical protein